MAVNGTMLTSNEIKKKTNNDNAKVIMSSEKSQPRRKITRQFSLSFNESWLTIIEKCTYFIS